MISKAKDQKVPRRDPAPTNMEQSASPFVNTLNLKFVSALTNIPSRSLLGGIAPRRFWP